MREGGQRKTTIQERKCTHIGYYLAVELKIVEKKKVLMHFQLLESNKKFMLIYMTAGGKGEGSDGLVFIVDGARNKELTIIVIGSYKGSQKRK